MTGLKSDMLDCHLVVRDQRKVVCDIAEAIGLHREGWKLDELADAVKDALNDARARGLEEAAGMLDTEAARTDKWRQRAEGQGHYDSAREWAWRALGLRTQAGEIRARAEAVRKGDP